MVKFTRVILVSTLVIESLGAILLVIHSLPTMGLAASIYPAIYHSINAFCTAGMSLWTDNMVRYQSALFPNLVLNIVELLGGIGFFILYDIAHTGKRVARGLHPRGLTTHSKLALTVTGVIVGVGAIIILLTEWPRSAEPVGTRLLTASFQAISAETTTGFNSVNISAYAYPALLVLMVLMFIGASPNSTGGGIKTTTFGVMVCGLWAVLKGREDITMFKRRLPHKTLESAFGLTLAAIVWVTFVFGAMVIVEPFRFEQILFEIVSAFGNVGLSTGITTKLSTLSRAMLSLTMFFGRLGPLAIGFSLIGKRESPLHHYAEDEVYVG
jgi:trk system potassium uptake protein TrkH